MLDPEQEEPGVQEGARQLREFSVAWLLFFCALGGWAWLGDGNVILAIALCATGISVGLGGLAKPNAIRPVFALAMAIAYPIGWVMNRLILGLLFFGLFTPVGWLFRRLRRDPLRLGRSKAASCWTPAPPPAAAESYFRQS